MCAGGSGDWQSASRGGWIARGGRIFLLRVESGVLLAGSSATASIWPGAMTLAAVTGAVRAWSGRSVANVAYLGGGPLIIPWFGAVALSRASHRLHVDEGA